MKRLQINYVDGNFSESLSKCKSRYIDTGDIIAVCFVDSYKIILRHVGNLECGLEFKDKHRVNTHSFVLSTEYNLKREIKNFLVNKLSLIDDNDFNKNINLIDFKLTEPNKTYLTCGELKVVTLKDPTELFLKTSDNKLIPLVEEDFESWEDVDSVVDSLYRITNERSDMDCTKPKECRPKEVNSFKGGSSKDVIDKLNKLASSVKSNSNDKELVGTTKLSDCLEIEFTLRKFAKIFGISEDYAKARFTEYYKSKK